ncbi:glycosyl transferase group 1 [Isosphaera pallida ATCC 43644]|uniref:Glycosyl transferase group 1 n=1 Tax=Isosphaera pallida (strain ATCC 43644 / DSM 9630 / IS1B) TaxID=575540 RepID=E8QYR7_ISOPI|nr:glycosyltransferase family 4 protein [Isosphaera pallida]ADV61043.1 glycosyl transferase group 1 [Isosphaera pallida ATCC 43644]
MPPPTLEPITQLAFLSTASLEPGSEPSEVGDGQRLRVGLLVSWFYPAESGAERQALEQGRELLRQGHQVGVVTGRLPGRPSFERIDGLEVHRVIRSIRLGPLFGLSYLASAVAALIRLGPRFDVIHTHQALWEAIAAGLARPGLGRVPVLVQPASSGAFGEADQLRTLRGWPILLRWMLRNDGFVAISREIADQWRTLGVPEDRLWLSRSGVDARRFHPGPSAWDRPTVDSPPSPLPPRPRVVFTGRLHPQKNLDFLIDVWPEARRRAGGVGSLLLAGDGPERDRLERLAACRLEEFGPEAVGSIRWLGRVADPSELLRACDLFVLPSVAEGMSNSLLEAMASGLPSVVSKIGGNVDLISEGPEATGRLVDPTDRDGWINALSDLLSDPTTRQAMGRRARARIEAEYDLPVVVAANLKIYRELIRRRSRGAAT